MIRSYVKDVEISKASKKVKANELFANQQVKMARYHMQYINFKLFLDKIVDTTFKDPEVKNVLLLIARIHALDLLVKDCGSLFDSGYISRGSFFLMGKAFEQSVAEFRPQALAIAEMY